MNPYRVSSSRDDQIIISYLLKNDCSASWVTHSRSHHWIKRFSRHPIMLSHFRTCICQSICRLVMCDYTHLGVFSVPWVTVSELEEQEVSSQKKSLTINCELHGRKRRRSPPLTSGLATAVWVKSVRRKWHRIESQSQWARYKEKMIN